MDMLVEPLGPQNTIEVDHVRHRLALGVQWFDALSRMPVPGAWVSELLAIGARPLPQRFELHPRGSHALRHAGRLAKLLQRAAADKAAAPPATPELDPTNFVLQAWGQASAAVPRYRTGNDPRTFVPRRLSLTPVQAAGIPSATTDNMRQAWLWPGAAYPLPGKASAVRGRVRRGPSPAAAQPVPWARLVFTRPNPGPANFPGEVKLGFAHGDDRGEFLAVFGADAVAGGAALPPAVNLHAWVFLPPAAGFDPADPLASLPLEVAGAAALNDVLRGTELPPGYLQRGPIALSLPLGTVVTMNEADLLFA